MSLVWGALRYEISSGVGANGAFLGEISEIVSPMLILDNQSSLQDLLSLCFQIISRKQKEESQSPLTRRSAPLIVLLWSRWAGIAIFCFPREEEVMGPDRPGTDLHRSAQICWTLVPGVLGWVGSDAWQGTQQCATCSLHPNWILESQNGLGSKGP